MRRPGALIVAALAACTGAPARAPAVAPAIVDGNAAPQRIVVRSIHGLVEGRSSGRARALRAGDELAHDDSIRTGENGSVNLQLGDDGEVDLDQQTAVSVVAVDGKGARLRVSEGRVAADVHAPPDREVAIEVAKSTAVAHARRGRFSLLTDGEGSAAVATTAGQVALAARDRTVELHAGERSIVLPDAVPTPPQRIPSSLFLKVAPRQIAQRAHETTVSGQTDPGALVTANGIRGRSDGEGRFAVRVPLVEGANRITVEARDASGRIARTSGGAVLVNSVPPRVRSELTW